MELINKNNRFFKPINFMINLKVILMNNKRNYCLNNNKKKLYYLIKFKMKNN